eukprot:COSAG02_NODE_2816_length_7969_cov_3.879670_1_plen_112_part_10
MGNTMILGGGRMWNGGDMKDHLNLPSPGLNWIRHLGPNPEIAKAFQPYYQCVGVCSRGNTQGIRVMPCVSMLTKRVNRARRELTIEECSRTASYPTSDGCLEVGQCYSTMA